MKMDCYYPIWQSFLIGVKVNWSLLLFFYLIYNSLVFRSDMVYIYLFILTEKRSSDLQSGGKYENTSFLHRIINGQNDSNYIIPIPWYNYNWTPIISLTLFFLTHYIIYFLLYWYFTHNHDQCRFYFKCYVDSYFLITIERARSKNRRNSFFLSLSLPLFVYHLVCVVYVCVF